MVEMKSVKLLVNKGTNTAGTIVEYDDSSAEWLVMNGYGMEVTPTATNASNAKVSVASEEAAPAPRRGRPRKGDKS